jgi:hypothetical protein
VISLVASIKLFMDEDNTSAFLAATAAFLPSRLFFPGILIGVLSILRLKLQGVKEIARGRRIRADI